MIQNLVNMWAYLAFCFFLVFLVAYFIVREFAFWGMQGYIWRRTKELREKNKK